MVLWDCYDVLLIAIVSLGGCSGVLSGFLGIARLF